MKIFVTHYKHHPTFRCFIYSNIFYASYYFNQ